jgi:hypothetical protein
VSFGRESAAEEIEDVIAALNGSGTLDLLGITADDLNAARTDTALFETLKITHELLIALRDQDVLFTFLLLPKHEQANFVRWIGATDEESLRDSRTETFISALKESPLAESARGGDAE